MFHRVIVHKTVTKKYVLSGVKTRVDIFFPTQDNKIMYFALTRYT